MKRNHKVVKQRLDRIVKLMKLGENIGEALYKINFFEYKDKDGKIKKDKELFLKRLKEKGKNYKLKTKRDSEIDISIEEEKKLFNLSKLLDKVTENKLNLNKKG